MAYIHPKDAETLCLTRDGKVVVESDPRAAFVLIAGGGTMSDADALKHGLTGKKQGAGPTQNKLAKPAEENKEPIPGYDDMTVDQVVAALEGADDATFDAVLAYEAARKARKGILEAL